MNHDDRGANLRWACLATGGIAANFATSIAHANGAELTAVVSRSRSSAEAFATRFAVPHASDDLLQTLARDDVDALYVATPSAHHTAPVREALEAGVPVLCEKPLAMTSTETEALSCLAHERNTFLMEAMWMRYLPAFRAARALVESGRIGQVRRMCAEFAIDAPFDPGHRLYARELGGGALHDLGVYVINAALAFMGTPDEIVATWEPAPTGVDRSADLEFRYRDGRVAHLTCAFTHAGANLCIVEGETGSLVLQPPFFAAQGFWTTASPKLHVPFGFASGGAPARAFRRLAKRLPLPGIKRHPYPFEPTGLQFEIEAATAAIRAGLVEEPDMPHERTIEVLRIIETALSDANRRSEGVR